MNKMILAMSMAVAMASGSVASAACNPCICGLGGGLPPPPECPGGGGWKKRSTVPVHAQSLLESVLSDKSVEQQVLGSGGLESVQCFESGDAVSFQLKTTDGAEYVTPYLAVPAR
ncbi:hypothetical protein [Bdellovibrio sp.]|uniref:hypothetical protein n=1 Tax=Bdellovibrio sp. TaxID=28201 RepID=UPI003221557C